MPLLPILIIGIPVGIVLSVLWSGRTGRRSGSGDTSGGYVPDVPGDSHHHSAHCGHSDHGGADSGGDSGGGDGGGSSD